jgi:hypothetical protein
LAGPVIRGCAYQDQSPRQRLHPPPAPILALALLLALSRSLSHTAARYAGCSSYAAATFSSFSSAGYHPAQRFPRSWLVAACLPPCGAL